MATQLEMTKKNKWPDKGEAEAQVYVAGDTFIFSTTTQGTLFTMPGVACMLDEIIVQPETAWVSNDIGIFFDDSGGNVLMEIKGLQSGLGQTTNALVQKVGRLLAAGGIIRINHWGTPTAGACKVWIKYRPYTDAMNPMGGLM